MMFSSTGTFSFLKLETSTLVFIFFSCELEALSEGGRDTEAQLNATLIK